MQPAQIREYKCRPLTSEMYDKLERSHQESLDLTERELRCPYCHRYMATLYSDVAGHFKAKCDNCKKYTIFNLGYFRRIHRHGQKCWG